MYDKYFNVTPIPLDGSLLPKHKGILFNVTNPAGGSPIVVLSTISGTTFSQTIKIPTGNTIFPTQIHSVRSGDLGTGVTAFYLN